MMEAFRNVDKKKEAADIAYIRNCLALILPLWAHNAWCYSPLLFQVPAAIPVEIWHSVLKRLNGSGKLSGILLLPGSQS
jgi:hypothetical protein